MTADGKGAEAPADAPADAPKRLPSETSWPSVLFFIHLHLAALYGIFLVFTEAYLTTTLFGKQNRKKDDDFRSPNIAICRCNASCEQSFIKTGLSKFGFVPALFLSSISILGVTIGSHRLWAHGAYKAALPLRIALMLAQTLVGQGPIYDWVLDHRIHHKHFCTELDPFNHKRGFSYAHITSHLFSTPTEYQKLRDEIDMSDVEEDKVVMFQKRFYWFMLPIIAFLLPVNAPVEYWGEGIVVSVYVAGFLRYCISIHGAWLVNSGTCIWGLDPNDRHAADTNLIFIVNKSHWPYYHYLLPWDYQTGEFGTYGSGCSTAFIRIFAAVGWAKQLKTIDSEAVKEALSLAVDTDKPLVDCLNKVGLERASKIPDDHVLNYEMYK